MIRNVLLGSAAAVLIAGSAFAADLPSKKAPALYAPVPTFTWTGFYLGANAGYGFGTDKLSDIRFRGNLQPGVSFDPKGGLVGGQIGYNYQIGNIVLGAEADLDYASVKGSYAFPAPVVALSTKLDYLGTVRARLGYAFNTVLLYATGGFAYGSVKSNLATVPAFAAASARTSETGYTLGGGVEYALTNNWTIKGEYLYVDFGKKSVGYTLVPGNTSVSASARVTTNVIRAGVNYKF